MYVCMYQNQVGPLHKGPFIFYERGGAGGIWEGGAMRKKTAFEGGPSQKKIGKKGGPREIF